MFTLEEITTEDGLVHQGILAEPQTPQGRAIVWIHGLTSTFYNNVELIKAVATESLKQHIALAVFNTRGHDMITGIRKIDPQEEKGYGHAMAGAGYENFQESVFDIDAVISFLKQKGYHNIVLVGHSTGANKACYYAATHDRKELERVVLASPMSDRLGIPDKQQLAKDLSLMQQKIEEGKGDELVTNLTFFPITPKRYISLFGSPSLEDQFDYGDEKPTMGNFSEIKKPLLVILAEHDETADRQVTEIRRVFDEFAQASQYKSVIIAESLHSFGGKEQEVADILFDWFASL